MLRIVGLMVFIGYACWGAGIAKSATIVVDTTDDPALPSGLCSLRDAVRAANSNSAVNFCGAGLGADTIVLPAGNYILQITSANSDPTAVGDLDVTEDLTILGAGRDTTTLSWTSMPGADRLIHVVPGVSARIESLTLEGGQPSATSGGGAILNEGELVLVDTWLRNNLAPMGGAIFNAGSLSVMQSRLTDNATTGNTGSGGAIHSTVGSTTLLVDVEVSGNDSEVEGGGITSEGTLTITGSTISMNRVLDAFFDFDLFQFEWGGGVSFRSQAGTLTITESAIINNSVIKNLDQTASGISLGGSAGGGVYVGCSAVLIQDSVIRANTVRPTPTAPSASFNNTKAFGGGVFLGIPGSFTGTCGASGTIVRSAIINNEAFSSADGLAASRGGGISVGAGQLILDNSTISGNRAVDGAGVHNLGTLQLLETTVVTNIASASGGGLSGNGTASFSSTVLGDNLAPALADCSSTVSLVGPNFTETLCSGILGDVPDLIFGIDGGFSALATDPTVLAGAPGLTQPIPFHQPSPGSAVIDAVPLVMCSASDQRGISRPVDGDGDGVALCDLGAIEFVPEPSLWIQQGVALGLLYSLALVIRRRQAVL